MPYLAKVFLKGSAVVLPLVVTLWLVWSALVWLDGVGLELLSWFGLQPWETPSSIPGFGLLVTVVGLFMVGLLFQFDPISWLFEKLESAFLRFPVVKTLYGAIKDFAAMFDKGEKEKQQPVVLVELPAMGTVVGFITNQSIPGPVKQAKPGEDLVAVYLPMSYMVGGYTLFLPRDQLTQVDWSFEDAMRFALTAGVSQSAGKPAASADSPDKGISPDNVSDAATEKQA